MTLPAQTPRSMIARLARHYGTPPRPFPVDPFEQVLWENVAYLVDDAQRAAAFKTLKREVGLSPEEILHAPAASLRKATAFGILPDQFIGKLRECAEVAIDQFDGDVHAVAELPLPKARRALRKFPGVGEPGAEKILLFAGLQPLLAPDSNALRVLGRLGVVPVLKSYAATYAAAREVTSRLLPADTAAMQRAHQLLRRHGQETCKRTAPACLRCPLATFCPRIGVTK